MRLKFLLAATAASLLATSAGAQTTSFVPGGSSPSAGYTVINVFDDTTGLTGSGFQVQTTGDGQGAPPATSNGSRFLTVLGGGSATYDLSAFNSRGIQFDWGSIDGYNTLTINTLNSGSFTYVPGTSSFPNIANGNQSADPTNGLFTFKIGDDRISSVTFASSQNSFELDNFAISGGVPEPATWALMIMGFGAVGGAMRRRKVATAAFA